MSRSPRWRNYNDPGWTHISAIKREIAVYITERIAEFEWTQVRAAAELDISQGKISALKHAKIADFSLDKLFVIAAKLDTTVSISLEESSTDKGSIRISHD